MDNAQRNRTKELQERSKTRVIAEISQWVKGQILAEARDQETSMSHIVNTVLRRWAEQRAQKEKTHG